jgi:hypothetical protein
VREFVRLEIPVVEFVRCDRNAITPKLILTKIGIRGRGKRAVLLHSYEVPKITALPILNILAGSQPHLNWISASV